MAKKLKKKFVFDESKAILAEKGKTVYSNIKPKVRKVR